MTTNNMAGAITGRTRLICSTVAVQRFYEALAEVKLACRCDPLA